MFFIRVDKGAIWERSGLNKESGDFEVKWKVYDKPPTASRLCSSKTKALKNAAAVRNVTMSLPRIRGNRKPAAVHSKWNCSCSYFKSQTPLMYCVHIMYVIMMRFPITDWPKDI